ncbi:hypothetical protein [Streptomyces sp. CC224B]|uniref:hypothetical protein n=1 Tax=Streptomyces sp. CC224B TaxID=3044571 RepID=UPI0024A801F5|nr:hypothetical protein [Streptomyces sp. CC224B]
MWITLVATLCGTAAGVASTLVADKVRWKRDRAHQERDKQVEICVEFLRALMRAYEGLYDIASREDRGAERNYGAVRDLVSDAGTADSRQLLLVTTPAHVTTACEHAFSVLRDLRDAVGGGLTVDTSAYQELDRAFRDALHDVRVEVRRSQGLADAEALRRPRVPPYRMVPAPAADGSPSAPARPGTTGA